MCRTNELSVFEVLGDVGVYTRRELAEGTQEIITALGPEAREKLPGPLRANWPFMPLKKWFAERSEASITLTFQEIERIWGRKLSPSVREYPSRWYTRPDQNAMAEAWVTEGYTLTLGDLDLKREKVTFRRAEEGMSHAKLPSWLTVGRIPDEAAVEIEGFFAYIKKKYGL